MPLFSLFEIPDYKALFSALRCARPQDAWRIMQELRELDEKANEEAYAADHRKMKETARRNMTLVPNIDAATVEAEAERFAQYPHNLQFHSTYLLLWYCNQEVLRSIVEVKGHEHFENARAGGRGVLVLPLHTGPSSSAVGLTAHEMVTTVLFHKMRFEELKALAFPSLAFYYDLLGQVNAVRSAVDRLRRQECYALFPEYDPRPASRESSHLILEFMGTRVYAPIGPASISKISKAPMVVMSVRSLGSGQYLQEYYPPISPPRTREDIERATHEVWRYIEEDLLKRGLGEWEMWAEFDRMVARNDHEAHP